MCALKIIEEWNDLNTNILLEISRVTITINEWLYL